MSDGELFSIELLLLSVEETSQDFLCSGGLVGFYMVNNKVGISSTLCS
jgi:hypothetical protein